MPLLTLRRKPERSILGVTAAARSRLPTPSRKIFRLSGDPGKAGPFTARLKTPAGYKIPAHQHPSAEAVTVISGEFNFGMGDKLDEAKAQKLGPSGFVDLPANMNHFAFATTEAVVQINSEGPFSIKYVNPADDPSKSQ